MINNFADVLADLGESEAALDLYKRALDGYTSHFGSGDSKTLNCIQNIASIYIDLKDFKAAKENLEIAVKGYESQGLDSFSGYYTALSNLAYAQAKLRHFDSAHVLFEKALKSQLQDKSLGERHPDTLRTYFNFGDMYFDKKDYRNALGYFNQAASGFELMGVVDNPMVDLARSRVQDCIDLGRIEEE